MAFVWLMVLFMLSFEFVVGVVDIVCGGVHSIGVYVFFVRLMVFGIGGVVDVDMYDDVVFASVGGVCDVGGVGVVMRHFDSVSLVFVMLFSFVVIGFVLPSLVLMIALVLLMCSSILLIML